MANQLTFNSGRGAWIHDDGVAYTDWASAEEREKVMALVRARHGDDVVFAERPGGPGEHDLAPVLVDPSTDPVITVSEAVAKATE